MFLDLVIGGAAIMRPEAIPESQLLLALERDVLVEARRRAHPAVIADMPGRRMIAIRNTFPALQLGSFVTLFAEDVRGLFAFARTLDDETVVTVLNNSDRPRRLDVPAPWPSGSTVLRLDDPRVCTVVDPPRTEPMARPMVRAIDGHVSPIKVIDGRLRGVTLGPRTGGVFGRVAKGAS